MRGVQTYSCNDCSKKWSDERREKTHLEKELWKEYVFKKQTLRELKDRHHLDKRTIRSLLDGYQAPAKEHLPRLVNLVADTLCFGERTEHSSWCVSVIRDPWRGENLWWGFGNTESTSLYLEGRRHLETLGYEIASVTGDGFGGLRTAFSGIPFQMCQVHMERIVIRGTTRKPELEAGAVLLALAKSLHDTDGYTFEKRLFGYFEMYQTFLEEKTIHPISGKRSWTHEGIHQAAHSLKAFKQFLFTFERDKRIPRTTNSLEGHFSHVRDIVEIHRGLSRKQKERVLHSIFMAGSIAPKKKKLDEII